MAAIAAIAANLDAAGVANRLTQELAIDCKSSGHQKTTRVYQALETLQGVLFSLRTGRFKTVPPCWARRIRRPPGCWRLTPQVLYRGGI